MRYAIRQDNYHDGKIFEINKLPPRSYFIPYPDRTSADRVTGREKRYASPLVQCLNGDWDFRFYPRPREMPLELDTEQVAWDRIAVPGCWQFQGYAKPFYLNIRYQFPFDPPRIPTLDPVGEIFYLDEKGKPATAHPQEEYNFVGVYRRFFQVDRLEGRYVISFLGVASCLDLYVNGEFVGYSEGAHNTAEFDLTGLLRAGQNELLAVVHRWCSGSYLECQDMFRNNGIFRDVLLRRESALWDLDVQTEKTGDTYQFTAAAQIAGDPPVRFTLSGHGLERSAEVTPQEGRAEIRFDGLPVSEWTAETPTLYDLYVETEGACVKCRVGFREICIEGRRFLVNGRLVKFHGVNHHDTSATAGYTMTPEELELDVRRCKEYNIDTIRTSHYPPDPYLLELCDEAGIYIVDEADLETHGVTAHALPVDFGRITHDPYWEGHYLDRALRLYQRDKLHPCIVMWSLGNESGGYRNTDAMYRLLKTYTRIPIHYESAIHSWRKAYDVGSEMYPSVAQVHKVGQGTAQCKRLNDRPYFLCEYAHAMGVGPGDMEGYWREIYASDALMGGCVWEMVDHAVLQPDGGYTYGGDHGEWYHDGNFCVDGIFYPDRTPSTGAKITRFVYRPLRVTWEGEDRFTVFNTRSFTPGDAWRLEFRWSDGREAQCIVPVSPLERRTVTVTPQGEPGAGIPGNRAAWVTVTTVEQATGRTVAEEQLQLAPMAPLPEARLAPAPWPEGVELGPDGLAMDGLVSLWPETLLTRVSTDNDRDLMGNRPLEIFYDGREQIRSVKREEGRTTVVTRLTFPRHVFRCTDTYEPVAGGILVTSRLHCVKGGGVLPRFGKCFRLDPAFRQVTYLGRNGESYRDMKDQAIQEQVTCPVSAMTEPNIRPQESGNRMDCQYAALSDGVRTVTFTAVDQPFELGVKPYSDLELRHMAHRKDEQVTGTYVTIQAFQMGIGTGSCGPATQKEYTFPCREDYTLRFLLSWEK